MSENILFIGDVHVKFSNQKDLDKLEAKMLQMRDISLIVVAGDILDTHERINTQLMNRAYTLIKKDMDSTSSSSNESLVKMDTTNPNQQFKVRIINNYIEKIDSDLYREMTVCRKYKRWLGACYWLNVTSSTVSVVMASGSLAALMNVITSPVVLPFTCIVAVSGITTLMTNLIGNKLQRKLKKHREFVNLMEIYQFQLREEIAEALTDALISNDELKAIINIIVAYEKDKRHISKKWMWKIRLSPENNSSSSNSQSR